MILVGGSYHPVDSSEMAFRYAAKQAFQQGFAMAKPIILEPIMLVEVETPEIINELFPPFEPYLSIVGLIFDS